MRKTFIVLLLLAFARSGLCQDQKVRLGQIEFFGVNSYDVTSIRASLSSYEGRELSENDVKGLRSEIREAVKRITSRPPADVTLACCDNHGDAIVYIGLSQPSLAGGFRYKAPPRRTLRLPGNAVQLYDDVMDLNVESVQRNAAEDRSKGYALSTYPPLRAKQLSLREYAVGHVQLLRSVALRSADSKQRAVAAEMLGYSRQSSIQITTLVSASRDRDEGVRNNAVRALGVLAQSSAAIARRIPADTFIDMLNSSTWTDRNKASFLVAVLSASRDPRLLHQLRVRALPALIEMARWHNHGHAEYSRTILGRVAGIPETELVKLVSAGEVDKIISAATRQH